MRWFGSSSKKDEEDIHGIRKAVQLLAHEIELIKDRISVPSIKKAARDKHTAEDNGTPNENSKIEDGFDELRQLNKGLSSIKPFD